MQNILIDMPVVGACSVAECAYNTHQCCHARAITVGDGVHPGCETFLAATPHARDVARHAGVGACKVQACQHNDDYACTAEQITVGHVGADASCLTYQQRLLSPASGAGGGGDGDGGGGGGGGDGGGGGLERVLGVQP